MGTATTLDIVKKNKYFGGVILPGLTTSYANLVDLASGIKKIKLENSNKVFGKNTKDALLSGFTNHLPQLFSVRLSHNYFDW